MARTERYKEEIGWLKVVFAAAIALDASLIAWVVQNYGTADPVTGNVALLTAALLTFLVVYVNRLAYRRIGELEG